MISKVLNDCDIVVFAALLQSEALKQDGIWSASIFQITQAIAFIHQLDLTLIQLEEKNGQGRTL
jgi:hypothetical protein